MTNRNYTQIVSLSSGANVSVNNAAIFGKASQDVSVNGANVNQNNYQMDGVNIINFAGTGTGADSGIYAGIGIPESGCAARVQDSDFDLRRQLRPQSGRQRERGHQIRQQFGARLAV